MSKKAKWVSSQGNGMEDSEPKDHLFGNGHIQPRALGLKEVGDVDLEWFRKVGDVGDEGFNA